MKLDLVITELNVGGAERALTELAIGIRKAQHSVRVLTIASAPKGPHQGQLVDRLRDADVVVEHGGFDRGRQYFSAANWLRRRLVDRPADLCQSFLFHANCLVARALADRGGQRVSRQRFVGGLRVAESRSLRLAMERRAVGRMDHLVCVSEGVRRFALQNLAVDPDRCSVIANSVDPNRFEQAGRYDWTQIGWPADSKVALFVGRFHQQKGLELIRSRIDRILGDDPLRRVALVGRGPLERQLTRWAESIEGNRVQILPWQARIEPLLQAAELLILPSHYEGMPNVVLEAMAAGLPVVCSRVEGSEELLGEDSAADEAWGAERSQSQGFERGDENTMAQLVDRFFRDAELRERVGQANRRFVADRFCPRQMVQRYLSLYETLVESRDLSAS